MSHEVRGSIKIGDSVDFNTDRTATPAYLAGRLFWDIDHQTLSCHLGQTDVTLQVGQEQHVRVTNKTGVLIPNGSVCYINGAQGNHPTIALADADLVAADQTIGVVTADIADNATGYLTTFGAVHGVDTSAFAAGDILYVSSTAGQITKTAPTHPKHVVRVGYALNATNNGTVFVSIHAPSELGDLHDVLISTPADKQILRYEASTGLWKNATNNLSDLADTAISSPTNGQVLGYDGATGKWQNTTSGGGTSDHTALSNLTTGDAGHTQFVLNDGKAGGQTVYGDTADGGDLTLNSTTSATKGQVFIGGSSVSVDETKKITMLGDSTDLGYGARLQMLARQDTGLQYRGICATQSRTDSANKGAAVIVAPRYANANAPFSVLGHWDNNTQRIIYVGGGGWATQPDATHINFYTAASYTESVGTSSTLRAQFNGLTNKFELQNGCDLIVDTNVLATDSTNNRVGIGNASPNQALTVGANVLSVDTSSAKIGVNVQNPTYLLEALGVSATSGSARFLSLWQDNSAMALGVGGGIMFSGRAVTGSTTQYAFGSIAGIKENNTSANTAAALSFCTRPNGGSMTEWMRLNSSGDVITSNILIQAGGYLVMPKDSGRGIKVDIAAPTWGWKDLIGNITTKGTGATNPTWAVYRGGIYGYQFTVNDECWLEFHVPHDYVPGTDIYIHAHWSHNSAAITSGAVTWAFETTYAKGHNQAAFPATVTPTVAQNASTTQYQHMIAEVQLSAASPSVTQIDSDNIEVDGLILVRCYLSANTMNGTPTPEPFLHFVDIHYQSSQLATKNKAPNFYT